MVGWAIAVHGGAGVDPNLPAERQEEAKRVIARCLHVGTTAIRGGTAAVDVVEMVVRELETDPVFNSGRGSALTRRGTVEMEASIMDGRGRRCGAVSGISTVKNPVSLARLVMDKSPHSYLAFDGAEEFAREQVTSRVAVCFVLSLYAFSFFLSPSLSPPAMSPSGEVLQTYMPLDVHQTDSVSHGMLRRASC